MFSSFFIMSQTLLEATRFKGRLARAWTTSTLALTATATGVMLSAGGAHAQTVPLPCYNVFPNSGSFTLGGFTVADFSPVNTPPTGTCQLTTPFPDQATLDVDFQPNIGSISNAVFQYSIASTVGAFLEARVDSDTDGIGGTTSVVKNIFSDPGFTTLIGTGTSTSGSQTIISLTDKTQTKIWVRDTYSASGTTLIDNMTNSYRTPGPLPILGAGTAFGFTRKLRSRIRASRLA